MRGQDIANKVVPGLGYFIAFLVSLGGLVFNIGNVGGAATGFNIVFGFPLKVGTVVAGVIGILIFLSKDAKNFMDKLTKYLGSIMIVTVLYVAFRSKPPVVEAIGSVGHLNEFPNLVFPIITLLGGSCGGYITFSGAHRLLDAGFSGTKDLPHVRRSVLMGVSVSGVMRILLFLAVLGVVTATPEVVGSEAWVASPPAAAFKAGAGIIGYKIFGLVILFAAITSIIGAAYTSVSFLKTCIRSSWRMRMVRYRLHRCIDRYHDITWTAGNSSGSGRFRKRTDSSDYTACHSSGKPQERYRR